VDLLSLLDTHPLKNESHPRGANYFFICFIWSYHFIFCFFFLHGSHYKGEAGLGLTPLASASQGARMTGGHQHGQPFGALNLKDETLH
jgi:hypothetical protein